MRTASLLHSLHAKTALFFQADSATTHLHEGHDGRGEAVDGGRYSQEQFSAGRFLLFGPVR